MQCCPSCREEIAAWGCEGSQTSQPPPHSTGTAGLCREEGKCHFLYLYLYLYSKSVLRLTIYHLSIDWECIGDYILSRYVKAGSRDLDASILRHDEICFFFFKWKKDLTSGSSWGSPQGSAGGILCSGVWSIWGETGLPRQAEFRAGKPLLLGWARRAVCRPGLGRQSHEMKPFESVLWVPQAPGVMLGKMIKLVGLFGASGMSLLGILLTSVTWALSPKTVCGR